MKTPCKMKEQFYLAHVVLYAKQWYGWSKDIYADLAKIFELDGYPGYRKTEREGITRRLKQAYDEWCKFLDTCPEYHYAHGQHFLENQMFNSYRFNERWPEHNFNDFCDVVAMAILAEFSHAPVEYMNIPCPTYTEECLPGQGGLFGNFSDWYEEANNNCINGNRKLAKFFNEKVQQRWKEINGENE